MPKVNTLKTGLHINNGVLDTSSLTEVKRLNKFEINKLTNLIFNTDYRNKTGLNKEGHNACFDPRNALIFYDNKGHIFDYVEICFECLNAESKSNKITIGTDCTQKYELLKDFFINAGIKYGTIKK